MAWNINHANIIASVITQYDLYKSKVWVEVLFSESTKVSIWVLSERVTVSGNFWICWDWSKRRQKSPGLNVPLPWTSSSGLYVMPTDEYADSQAREDAGIPLIPRKGWCVSEAWSLCCVSFPGLICRPWGKAPCSVIPSPSFQGEGPGGTACREEDKLIVTCRPGASFPPGLESLVLFPSFVNPGGHPWWPLFFLFYRPHRRV